jgi:hypothetical protein
VWLTLHTPAIDVGNFFRGTHFHFFVVLAIKLDKNSFQPQTFAILHPIKKAKLMYIPSQKILNHCINLSSCMAFDLKYSQRMFLVGTVLQWAASLQFKAWREQLF